MSDGLQKTEKSKGMDLDLQHSKPPKRPAFATNIAQEELFLMDSYYKELMQRERMAFERILVSKLNVRERDVERKLQK